MRRLLYLALALVLLALAGLVFVRVTRSPAVVARLRSAPIRWGLPRERVHELLADLPLKKIRGYDSWEVGGGYRLVVGYALKYYALNENVIEATATGVQIRCSSPRTLLDEALEFIGYPEAYPGNPI